VVLHDVAPARWGECVRLLRHVQAVAAATGVRLRLTLLVVPLYHGLPTSPAFVHWLQRLAQDGHELVLHGWQHRDDAPVTGGWREQALRRCYTAGEGEFAALAPADAQDRLRRGRAWFAERGLHCQGFVAPAWLMSAASWDAVEAAGFAYTCTLTELVALPGRRRLASRSLVFSTRSAWRRMVSVAWNHGQAAWQQPGRAPLLRLELHPADADHASVRRCWSRVLAQALRQRRPVTLGHATRALLPLSPATGEPGVLAA
jgi:predicted deacetylase